MDAHVPERAQVGRLSRAVVLAAVLAAGNAAALEPLCSLGMIAATAASLKHPGKTAHEQACRNLPAAPGQAAMALVFVRPGSEPDEWVRNAGILDLEVVVVGADGKVMRRLKREDVFAIERERFDGLAVDTGRYDLAPGVRAFGVRAKNTGSSNVDIEAQESLSLYIDTGGALQEVVRDLLTMTSGGLQTGECEGKLSKATRTIDLGPGSTKGFRDLVVTTKSVDTVSRMAGKKCTRSETKAKTTTQTLRYDGRRYVVPSELEY